MYNIEIDTFLSNFYQKNQYVLHELHVEFLMNTMYNQAFQNKYMNWLKSNLYFC